jgi:hypothetical protein
VRPSPVLRAAAEAFGLLARAYEGVSGRQWETIATQRAIIDDGTVKFTTAKQSQIALGKDDLMDELLGDSQPTGEEVIGIKCPGRTSLPGLLSSSESDCDEPPETSIDAARKKLPDGPRPIVLCSSRCRIDVSALSMKLSKKSKVSIKFDDSFKVGKTTHLIVGTLPPPSQGSLDHDSGVVTDRKSIPYIAAGRTLKYMQAVLSGIWIVSEQWVLDCISSSAVLDPTPYEVLGDEAFPDEAAPRRARLSVRTLGDAPSLLFENMCIGLVGQIQAPTQSQLQSLIELGGGRFVKARSVHKNSEDEGVIWLYDDRGPGESGLRPTVCECVPVSWLLSCIASFQILDRTRPPYSPPRPNADSCDI